MGGHNEPTHGMLPHQPLVVGGGGGGGGCKPGNLGVTFVERRQTLDVEASGERTMFIPTHVLELNLQTSIPPHVPMGPLKHNLKGHPNKNPLPLLRYAL